MKNSLIVVTGGGSGIGRAVVLACAHRGARVAALDIDELSVKSVAAEAIAAGAPAAMALHCDVRSEESVSAAFDQIVSEEGLFDGVFANAGIEINAPLHTMTIEQWQHVIDVNLTGVFLTCKHALRHLVQSGAHGSIVCCSSPSAFVGFAGGGNGAYGSSKGGISALVRSTALDYAKAGVRVNGIVPGATDTPIMLVGVPVESQPEVLRQIREAAKEQVPLGRLASPDEIASAVVWLLSNDSSYVTGSNLVCDGGLMAKSANTF